MAGSLSPEQVAAYRRDGCLLPLHALDTAAAAGYRHAIAMPVRGSDASGNWIHVAPPTAPFAPADMAFYEQVLVDQSVAPAAPR